MSAGIRPLVCSPDIARIIGAKPYADPPNHYTPQGMSALIVRAATRVEAEGSIVVLTHGRGAVWAWPVMADARNTGAGL